ncbi:hypothetical protein [Egicoccus halophilus]|uniref:Uncharacterized protein n=1 Tax=Egicoccus halophilus TaxID=1670830 RepID=A0A8J3ABM2_9ACTN|nr:hypothetical protein [Egicoccus halophilus]GGI09808.1 hypothetical protein GCM10011354_35910 [Egicoccus halophilus]
MRHAGLDVAALTDHTVAAVALSAPGVCAFVPDPPFGQTDPCSSTLGMTGGEFERTAEYADAADDPHRFTALRGFEWSSPYLGHINVWFTRDVTDPLETGGLTAEGLARIGITLDGLRALLGPLADLPGGAELLDAVRDAGPDGMAGFYEWLRRSPSSALGGGADGIAGFNHPNREPEVFDAFAYDERVRDRMVSMEILNRNEDYLFKNFAQGLPSPLVACLDAGWHVGLTGVTDEHGTNWGEPDDKGRTGLWLDRLTRDGVFAAMKSRRMFATRERGLRLDVGASGNTRMGGTVPGNAPRLDLEIDLDWGAERAGMPLEVQVLTSGDEVPTVVHTQRIEVPAPRERRPIRVSAPVDRRTTSWAVVRIADPSRPNATPGPAGHPCNDYAVAYASPFYLAGATPRRSSGPRPGRAGRHPWVDGEALLRGVHA